jgi:hypothetical protein
MNKSSIAAILAFTGILFSDESFVNGNVENRYMPIDQGRPAEYKPDKKNCDLCVNLPRKRKTIQV